MRRGKLTQAIAAIGLAIVSGVALAQTDATTPAPQPGPEYGPGMMRGYGMHGYGPGMMGGCPGNGYGCYGPGMMGGYGPGYGPGMMGGYGPGMMGGYGPGMMGGYGPGWGRGGPGWGRGYGGIFSELDLSADQQQRIAKIQEDMRAKNWATMGELRSEQFKLRGQA
jgi:Spy/CpxP family protein refolding chaperone